jgi:hypothetical protein
MEKSRGADDQVSIRRAIRPFSPKHSASPLRAVDHCRSRPSGTATLLYPKRNLFRNTPGVNPFAQRESATHSRYRGCLAGETA